MIEELVIEKLKEERSELENKIHKLKMFIYSGDKFLKLDCITRGLLISQENAMVTYHEILNTRILYLINKRT